MRILEVITEDVVLKLEKGLKKLPSHSYDSIDKLMQKLCKDHDISGKKLHDMFVDKHNLTPDTWIKKLYVAPIASLEATDNERESN